MNLLFINNLNQNLMKKVLLFLVAFFTLFGAVKAQSEDATISADAIQYWVGEGQNQIIVIISWCEETETAFAWGYRFDSDSVIVADAMAAIAASDNRLTIVGAAPSNITYQDDTYDLTMEGDYPCFNVNGAFAQDYFYAVNVGNGDVVKFGASLCANYPSDYSYMYWTTPVQPAVEPGTDVSFSPNLVQYWVGEGWNEVVFSVVWNGKALAWGYRFDEDTTTVQDAMDAIAASDTHFSVIEYGSYVSDFLYVEGTDTFRLSQVPDDYPGYFYFNLSVNHEASRYGVTHPLVHGDFVKWADNYVATITDSTWVEGEYPYWDYTYVWPQLISPAPAPEEAASSEELFDGIVGTEGCQAIHYSDPAILGWASTCTVKRGPQNIMNPTVFASFGNEENAVGAIDTINSMDVVCLGDYGSAVLTFDTPIQDGEGYDFAVFENAFDDNFLELAFVEVSSDGVNYFRFPSVSNTQTDVQIDGFGSLDATKLHNLAGKYKGGWGTPFDLADLPEDTLLDITNITHVKIVDVVGCVNPRYATRDSRGHIINDPYPNNVQGGGTKTGFDLAGVCVMNGWRPAAVREYVENSLNVYPNPCNTQVTVETNIGEPVMLFNSVGKLVYRTIADNNSMVLNVSDYPAGLYIVKCGNRTARIVKM